MAWETPLASDSVEALQLQMSFNLQYLQLRSQMQTETATGTAISNLIKAKQDEVKAIVENIR